MLFLLKKNIFWLGLNFLLFYPFLSPASELPEVPDTGKPETDSAPGATRTGSEDLGYCSPTDLPFTSLLAQNSVDYTISAFPTFWFYVPYLPEEIKYLEFRLTQLESKQIIYRTALELTKSGIIGITLPQESQYSLIPEQDYLWEVIVYCVNNETTQPDLTLEGWIHRVSQELEEPVDYNVYIQEDLLYDAVTALIEAQQQQPSNRELKQDWLELLELLGWQELAAEPLVD